MSLSKQYDPLTAERATEQQWREAGVYHFDRDSDAPVYACLLYTSADDGATRRPHRQQRAG